MLKDLTKEFYSYFFPKVEIITQETVAEFNINDIISKSILLYGGPGSGKTETTRKIVEVVTECYGEDNVSVFVSETGNLSDCLNSLDNKLVNIIFVDNITRVKINDSVMLKYFRIRNLWAEKIKRHTGLIITILGVHRFHGTKAVDLRTNLDAIIWKNSPMNLYDQYVAKAYIGDEGLSALKDLDDKRSADKNLRGISIFNLKTNIGLLVTPLAKRNYFKKIDVSWEDTLDTVKKILAR